MEDGLGNDASVDEWLHCKLKVCLRTRKTRRLLLGMGNKLMKDSLRSGLNRVLLANVFVAHCR